MRCRFHKWETGRERGSEGNSAVRLCAGTLGREGPRFRSALWHVGLGSLGQVQTLLLVLSIC